MNKTITTCFFLLLGFYLFPQKGTLKHPLTETDFKKIDASISSCFGFNTQLKINYSTDELFNSKVIPDKPASIEETEKLKKKLKGTDEDRDALFMISGIYSRLQMQSEAMEYYNKGSAILTKQLELYPDSAELHYSQAMVYMSTNQLDKSIEAFSKTLQLKPNTAEHISIILGNLYYMNGRPDSSGVIIERYLKNLPENEGVYRFAFMYYFYNYSNFMSKVTSAEELRNMSIDSLIEMPLMETYYTQHKENPDVEFTFKVARSVMLNTASLVAAISDTLFDDKTVYFTLPEKQKQLILSSMPYFESCLKSKNKNYHLYANRVLGNSYILLNQPAKAIPYFKKAISLKPLSNSSLSSNEEEDYNNVLAVYLILHDTIQYQQFMEEKIKAKPAIDPSADDYVKLAGVYMYTKSDKDVSICLNKALAINPRHADALLGLGWIKYKTGFPEQASTYIDRVYNIDKNNWLMYIIAGTIALRQNDALNAYESFKVAKKLHDRKWIQEELLDYFMERN